jgi:hypothetical protein
MAPHIPVRERLFMYSEFETHSLEVAQKLIAGAVGNFQGLHSVTTPFSDDEHLRTYT